MNRKLKNSLDSIKSIHKMTASEQFVHEKNYWKKILSNNFTKTTFPVDRSENNCQNGEQKVSFRERITFSWEGKVFQWLMKLRNGADKNLHLVLVGGLQYLLYKYSNRKDIVIGTPILKQSVYDNLVNYQLIIRNQITDEMTFRELLNQTKKNMSDAYKNQNYPLEILASQMDFSKNIEGFSFFDVAIVLGNIHDKKYLEYTYANVIFSFFRHENFIEGEVEYNSQLYEENTVLQWCFHLEKFFQESIFYVDYTLDEFELLTEKEKIQLLFHFNNTNLLYPKEKTIHNMFENKAIEFPDSISIVYKETTLSYRKLNNRANQLAYFLITFGYVQPEDRIGIIMERSHLLLETILGILKSGAAYVPMLPNSPEKRIKMIINDSQIKFVLSERKSIGLLNRLQWEVKSFDGYLCLDYFDTSNDESQEMLLMEEQMWDYVGDLGNDEISRGGWHSSFTGEPFSRKEMEEYSENIYKKLISFLNKDMQVLEIGCASGLTMYQLAPYVAFYHGTDLSESMIRLNQKIIKEEGFQNITLSHLSAHNIDKIEIKNFDLVIINSVVQYFPGHKYLRQVIRKAIDSLNNIGYIFIGDIMDQDLKANLIRELIQFKKANRNSTFRTKFEWNAELFLSRDFLEDLVIEFPEIYDIEFSDKIHTIKNELTKFRYDALIKIDKLVVSKIKKRKRKKNQYDLSNLDNCSQHVLPDLGLNVKSHQLAYAIYTSGSTGAPKGVMIEHRNVVNFIFGCVQQINFQPGKTMLAISNIMFDISILELLLPLTQSMKVVVADDNQKRDLDLLRNLLLKNDIKMLQITPSQLQTLVDSGDQLNIFEELTELMVGGEVFPQPLLKKIRDLFQGNVFNLYGPTETTVWSTIKDLSNPDVKLINIGKPIANTQIYILNKMKNLQPIGVVGDLYISGDGLSRGYLNHPELTACKFCLRRPGTLFKKTAPGPRKKFLLNEKKQKFLEVQKPFRKRVSCPRGDKYYKTGDLARWLSNGNIEFFGRKDYQVKIRGYRIELGEIEAHILGYYLIKECVVIVRDDKSGDKYLCAYFISDGEVVISDLRDYLSLVLPNYMIPSYFLSLDKMPVNPSGKIDRRALPLPELSIGESQVKPRDEIERKLQSLWGEVLGIDATKNSQQIGIDNSFFEMGGHSLKATILISKLHRVFQVKIPLTEIFKSPTIRRQAEYIREASQIRYESIQAVEKKEYYLLSSSQKRLYILHQLDLKSTAYNMPYYFPLAKDISKRKLEEIFIKLLQRHESLRTSFLMINEEPMQRILDEVEFDIIDEEKSKESFGFGEIGIKEIREQKSFKIESLVVDFLKRFTRPFDLSLAPLLRVSWLVLDSTQQFLFLDMHHIVTDGTSQMVLEREFMSLYFEEALTPLRLQYKDFSEWQYLPEQKESLKFQETYWLEMFSGDVPVLNLPTDYSRPLLQGYEGNTISFIFNESETRLLNEIASTTNTTLYISILAVYSIILSKLSSQEDIVVGTPIAARRHTDLEPIVGMFVNTLAMRNYPHSNMDFLQYVNKVKENTLDAYENQEYQFEVLVENIVMHRDTSRNPIFDVMLNLLTQEDYNGAEFDNSYQGQYIHRPGTSKFDLNLTIVDRGSWLFCSMEYSTLLFKPSTIERFIGYFHKILNILSKKLSIKLAEIDILPRQEKEQILKLCNGCQEIYDKNQRIETIFHENARKTPGSIAVVFKDHELSYQALNESSNYIAHYLRNIGVMNDSVVGIMMERSLEMIIGILGILKVGAGYLPIDQELPVERINYMLFDSDAKFLITTSHFNNKIKIQEDLLTGHNLNIVFIDQILFNGSLSHSLTFSPSHFTNFAYIIYTSGTTGKPKGMIIDHKNVIRLLINEDFKFDFGNNDIWTLFHSYCFDFSVWEIFGALLFGGKLVVVPKIVAMNSIEFLRILQMQKVTVLNQTPSAFYQLKNYILAEQCIDLKIRYIIFGGEALSIIQLKEWIAKYPSIQLINMYGITETTVHVTYKKIGKKDIENHLNGIGEPLPNVSLYVMDKNMNLNSYGIPGELCIAGSGVGRGYLNRPELTKKKFIVNPYKKGEIIYRSGDLGKWINGEIEYLGRIDHQVKIRGFRIELGEIEHQLLEIEWIKDTVVTEKEDESGDKYLCAYIVAGKEVKTAEIRKVLSKKLPDYMIPAFFVRLDKIPLTANGKVNKQALPGFKKDIRKDKATPRNEIEKILIRIWSRVLGLEKEKIGIDDNFFELGGHSLKAMKLTSKIYQVLKTRVPLSEIFNLSTIRKLSVYVKEAEVDEYISINPAEKKEYYLLSSVQRRLYFLQNIEPKSTAYNMPRLVPFKKEFSLECLENSINQLIARHESLRTSFTRIGDELIQRVHEHVALTLDSFDLMKRDEGKAKEIPESFVNPFNLSRIPLIRIKLLKTGTSGHILFLDMHHIITDAISNEVLIHDFMCICEGEELIALKLQYKDYTEWQNSPGQQELMKRQELYWLGLFSGELPVINIPTDYPRPSQQTFEGAFLNFELSKEETETLKYMAGEFEATLYMLMFSIFSILLSKICGQEDIIIGSPIAGRRHRDIENVVGMFANTLAIRNYPVGNKKFKEFLAENREQTLTSFENQDYPFDDLVDKISCKRDPSRNPVFDVMFALQNNRPLTQSRIPQFAAPMLSLANKASKFDLTLIGFEGEDTLSFTWVYKTKLFHEKTIKKFITFFKRIVSMVIKNPDIRLYEIEIVNPGDKTGLIKKIRKNKDYRFIQKISQNKEKSVDSNSEADFNFN